MLFLVHSKHDIEEHSPNGRVGQGDDGGEHRGIVEKFGNVHSLRTYAFNGRGLWLSIITSGYRVQK